MSTDRLLLPLEAVARTAGILVARPRAAVVHVATPAHALTPSGRLSRGDRPLCNQPGRPCHRARFDGRPLCRRCITRVSTLPSTLHQAELTEPRLRATIAAASTPDEVGAAVRLLVSAPAGLTARLAPVVRDRRSALGLNKPAPLRPLPPQRTRRPRKRAAWQPEAEQ